MALDPVWMPLRIAAAPKIRQIYWCDFWEDIHLPEMWKRRPVVVISYKNRLRGPCLVVPTSTIPQDNNPWAYRLSVRVDDLHDSWAICNQPSTVSPSRFCAVKGKPPLLPRADFNAVLALLLKWLPKPFVIEN
jgi:Uncharacterized protein conserved in bacteria